MLKALAKYHHKRVCQKLLTHPQIFSYLATLLFNRVSILFPKSGLSLLSLCPRFVTQTINISIIYYVKGIVKMELYPGSIFSQYQQET